MELKELLKSKNKDLERANKSLETIAHNIDACFKEQATIFDWRCQISKDIEALERVLKLRG